MPFNWNCPYCENKTTINTDNHSELDHDLTIKNKYGRMRLITEWIVCPNEECLKPTLVAKVHDVIKGQYGNSLSSNTRFSANLMPNVTARQYPEYIPFPLRKDYEEAVSIQILSPKASATLSRRCLQGMIRDYWGVSKSRLIDEINAIQDKIDPLTWKSIDAIRKVGNIGAHMEKDINLIIEVEPEEAILMISLIELLFEEWYINKHEREEKLNAIIAIASNKDAQKKIS
jgi:hypothetical protein